MLSIVSITQGVFHLFCGCRAAAAAAAAGTLTTKPLRAFVILSIVAVLVLVLVSPFCGVQWQDVDMVLVSPPCHERVLAVAGYFYSGDESIML